MSSKLTMYSGASSNDAFETSPAVGPPPGLLASHSPYDMEVRRNSDVSSLSLSSFTTLSSDYSISPSPICGRSPFSADSFDTSILELSHGQPVHILPIEYHMEASVFEESLAESWTGPGTASHALQDYQMQFMVLEQQNKKPLETTRQGLDGAQHQRQARPGFGIAERAMPIRAEGGLQFPGSYFQAHPASYTEMPWCSSSSAAEYGIFGSHIDEHGVGIDPATPLQPFWDLQAHQTQEMTSSTIAPGQALLGGDCIHVDPDVDMDTDSYDNADAPLSPSPQEVVFKQESSSDWVKPEPELLEDETKLKRIMYVSPTGGKSVKTERRGNRLSEKKKMKTKMPQKFEWCEKGGFHYPARIEKDPKTGKKRWADLKPLQKYFCKFPYDDNDSSIPHDHPGIQCRKPFRRPEHRARHRLSHSPAIAFSCPLCTHNFNRNDNGWAHSNTHVRYPGKGGRNPRFSLRQVISVTSDPKHIKMMLRTWLKNVKSEYNPEDEEDDEPKFQAEVMKIGRVDPLFVYDAEEAVCKIRSLPPDLLV